ncbi:hypothetical protein K2173_023800 [Erythroxylum novogranatense]|uniref:Uncharacterized protein n=1 Tax=Erythroxylum novogranatense TaxID=1862640 RepID=A0AAV8TK01_9ROSI|nr:hypothetical protein K2173_023800 [Erythroxylum novogranatense]
MGQLNIGDLMDYVNTDWSEALKNYESVIESGIVSMQVKATIKLARLAKHVPSQILARTIPVLAKLLESSSSDMSIHPIQEAAAYCLKRVACRGDGALAVDIGQSGATSTILRLLPRCSDGSRQVLLRCLWCLVNFDGGNRVIVARNGGLGIILHLLSSYMHDDRRYLLEVLSALALLREVRRVLIRLRGLRYLVEAARFGCLKSRERACQALGLLGLMRRVRFLLFELGVIPVLVELFHCGDNTTKLIVGNSLGVICTHIHLIRPLAEAGAIPLYAELLQGADSNGKDIAEDVFCLLAVDEENALAIADQLVKILKEGDDEAKIAASDVLWDLSSYKHSVSLAGNSGAIPVLIELLQDDNENVREKVSATIAQLSYDEGDRVILADAGAVPALIELLGDDVEEIRDNVVEALINISEDQQQRDIITEAVDASTFASMQNRLAQLRLSDEHMVRSMRRMSIEQLTWDPDVV